MPLNARQWMLAASVGALAAVVAHAARVPTTIADFVLPGTQPLSLTHEIASPNACATCHADFGDPAEPMRNWRGSMMAQSGRDPLFWAAVAVANQDADHAGETCLRCHLPKGWLEGRSIPEDGSSMTAADREGVQCSVCHRMVDPTGADGHPPEDDAIRAALTMPPVHVGSGQYVIDPADRLRGPFDIIADLGDDPHQPSRTTLVSPFHRSAALCGTCHDLSNPTLTRTLMGTYEVNPIGEPIADLSLGFPEQRTYSEWLASAYAGSDGVLAPQYSRNRAQVATCQDCHMPDVTGRDANLGLRRDDLPLHQLVGANTFVPAILPGHPAFGGEVDPAIMAESISTATLMLRKGATVEGTITDGALTVRVTNETGHKLPTGYPEGRRMWLHVRAFDRARRVVFESGRYVFETADLQHDPHLKTWEVVQGLSDARAMALGLPPGQSFHLVLNDTIFFDNRIPPRGFTNAAYAAFGGEPVGVAYPDGQFWDDTTYPVGDAAMTAEVVLYYQTASKEYVTFLNDENVTTSAGPILFDLWDNGGRSAPVEVARVVIDAQASRVRRCRTSVARSQARHLKGTLAAWLACYATATEGRTCDAATRDERLAEAEAALRAAIGGDDDARCRDLDYTPQTLGHAGTCPAPCAVDVDVHDLPGLATCTTCQTQAFVATAIGSAYGTAPPEVPRLRLGVAAQACQENIAKAAVTLAKARVADALRCRRRDPESCDDAADGPRFTAAAKAARRRIARCRDFANLEGCGASGDPEATAVCLEDAVRVGVSGVAKVAYP